MDENPVIKTTDDLPRNDQVQPTGTPYYAPPAAPGTAAEAMHGDSALIPWRIWYLRQNASTILTGLTVEKLRAWLRDYNIGYIKFWALMAQVMLDRDDTLKTVSEKRAAAIGRKKWTIQIQEGQQDNPQAKKQQKALEYFYNNLRVSSVIDQNTVGGANLLARQMVINATAFKHSPHEILWRQSSADGVLKCTAQINSVPLWFFENRTGRLRFLPNDTAWDGVDLARNGWIVASGAGVMQACSIMYLFKMMSLGDWVRFNEQHGIARVIAETKAPVGSEIFKSFEKAVEMIWKGANGTINSESGTIKTLDFGTTGELPFQPLVERCDRGMASLWRGADLSTISATAGDAGQGASVQGDEKDSLEDDDCQMVSETLQLQLDPLVLEMVFGPETEALAYFSIGGQGKVNAGVEMATDTGLWNMGVPLDTEELYERYGRKKPDGAPDTVVKPAGPGGAGAAPVGDAPQFGAGSTMAGWPDVNADGRQPATDYFGQALANSREGDRAFLALAGRQLAKAQAETLKPLRDRLKAALALSNEQEFRAALAKIRHDLPSLLLKINQRPETARALEQAMGAAMVDGLTTTRN